MICRYCGYENEETSCRCSRCGRQLAHDTSAAAHGWAPQEAGRKTYAQLAQESDNRRREERARRREDGKTCAGIAAVLACGLLLIAGISAAAYMTIFHRDDTDGAAEMRYTSESSAEAAEGLTGETTEETGETAAASGTLQSDESTETEQEAEPETEPEPVSETTPETTPVSEAAPEITPAPGAVPELPDEGGAAEETQQGPPDGGAPDGEAPECEAPADTQDETTPEAEAQNPPEAENQGPHGIMWDIITGLYSIGADAA